MRKDVKFGLTIGAILLATLAVYVIVLSRGGAGSPGNPDVSSAAPSPGGDATTPPSDASTPPAPDNKPAAGDVTAGTDTANGTAPAPLPTPSPAGVADSGTPATEPSAAGDVKTDWNYALTHGQVKLLAAAGPERTETPTIETGGAAVAPPTVISSDVHAAMIDAPPTTQPSVQTTASITPASATPTVAEAAPSGSGQRTHRIARGETLSSIAAMIYGNSKYYTKILAANPGLDPRHLKIGATVVIPELAEAEKTAASGSAVAAAAAAIDPAKEYTVDQGDTLEKIAVKLYGDQRLQEKIYDLNKGLIGPDEDRLKIGWVLKLPQPPTTTAATAVAHQ